MTLRACFPAVTLTTLILLTPCLAGEFGQTHQYFAQYGVGGPAETAFTIHDPGDAAILVEVALMNSDGTLFQMEEVAVGPGAAETVVFSDPEGEVRNGWARLSSDQPFSATVFFRIAGVGNVGVLPSEKGVKFKLFSFVGDGTDTGFAVANPSETQESTVTARIFSTAGEFQREVEKTYGPGEHEALFVTQEPLLVEADSLIEFTATQPVILLGLRSDNNLLASTAVIRPQGDGLEPGSVDTEHLADGAVTGPKIADGAVVRSLNGLTDDIALVAGENVEIQGNGNELTLSAAAGGGGTINPVVGAYTAILGETGMRKSEGLRLEWGHVDLSQRRLTVAQSKTGHPRYIPLSGYALERLMALTRHLGTPCVFMQSSGKPWKDPRGPFKEGCKVAGLDWVRGFHDLRHFRATMWLQHGVDVHTVQRYLGHTRIETTMRYLHFVEDYAEKAVRAAQNLERKQWEKLSQRGRQIGDTQEAHS